MNDLVALGIALGMWAIFIAVWVYTQRQPKWKKSHGKPKRPNGFTPDSGSSGPYR